MATVGWLPLRLRWHWGSCGTGLRASAPMRYDPVPSGERRMRKFFGPTGTVHRLVVESEALKGNILGDPTALCRRRCLRPRRTRRSRAAPTCRPGRHDQPAAYPTPIGPVSKRICPERLDPCLIPATVSCRRSSLPFRTALYSPSGGNQYVNSAATGAWEDFLIDEMLLQLSNASSAAAARADAACSGKAPAVTAPLPMPCATRTYGRPRRAIPAIWGFEGLCYLPDMPATLRALAGFQQLHRKSGGVGSRRAKKRPDGIFAALNVLAMAASYDPDPAEFLGMRLPVTTDTCELIEERMG